MASFLKLLAQTLFGYEFKSLELNQLHPPGKGSLGEGDLFGGEGVMAILSKYANFPLQKSKFAPKLGLHTKFELNSSKYVVTTQLPPK